MGFHQLVKFGADGEFNVLFTLTIIARLIK
jgi:hypothetical protein